MPNLNKEIGLIKQLVRLALLVLLTVVLSGVTPAHIKNFPPQHKVKALSAEKVPTEKPEQPQAVVATQAETVAAPVAAPAPVTDPHEYAASVLDPVQYGCLVSLWNGESGWRVGAYNPSGAYGIPQSLPASKMAAFGSDYLTNPITQVKWGLDYIARSYGTPCNAYNTWLSRYPHWY